MWGFQFGFEVCGSMELSGVEITRVACTRLSFIDFFNEQL